VVRYLPRYFDNNAFADNTNLYGKSLTGDGTGSITGFNIPLYLSNSLSVYDAITAQTDVRKYLPSGFVTDASIDYATYIQQALDYCGIMGGGTVLIPDNLALLTNRINIRYSNVHLLIKGSLISVPNASLTTAPFNGTGGLINIYPIGYVYGVEGVKINNVSVKGSGYIIGPYTAQHSFVQGSSAIIVESCNNFVVSGIHISQFAAENIIIGPATISNYALIEKNEITGGGETGVSKSYGSTLSGNYIHDNYSMNGISIGGVFTSVINNFIDNVYLNGITVGGNGMGAPNPGAINTLVQGNHIYRASWGGGGYGIFINEDDATFPVQLGIIVSGNSVYKSQGGYGIVGLVNNDNSSIIITNNTVSDTQGNNSIGIWIDGSATYYVSGNTVYPGLTGGQSYGIFNGSTYGTSTAYISSNHVKGHSITDIGKNPTAPNAHIYISINDSSGLSVSWSNAPPTDNTVSHNAGEVIFNTGATEGSAAGWLCAAKGSPGTWTAFYTIYGTPNNNDVVKWVTDHAQWSAP
jgi:hypothetical protein